MMKAITVIRYGSYKQYALSIHATGCADIGKDRRRNYGTVSTYNTLDEALDDWLDTGDESNPGFIREEINVLPCTKAVD